MAGAGWNLESGAIPFSRQSESDVIRLVNAALSPAKKHTTSYKYAFFKAILDNLFNVDLVTHFLGYDAISMRYTEIYWNLVLRFHLRQMPQSDRARMTSVERRLFDFCGKYGFDHSVRNSIFPFENLRGDLQVEINNQIKSEMMKNVVGAFYADTEGQLYTFCKRDGGIRFNPDSYAACVKFKSDFEKINYFEWIKYLEKVNAEEDAYALAGKLDESTERRDGTRGPLHPVVVREGRQNLELRARLPRVQLGEKQHPPRGGLHRRNQKPEPQTAEFRHKARPRGLPLVHAHKTPRNVQLRRVQWLPVRMAAQVRRAAGGIQNRQGRRRLPEGGGLGGKLGDRS